MSRCVRADSRLRVGVLLPADSCVAWVEHLVREIAATSVAEVALVGVAKWTDPAPRPRACLLWRM